MMLGATAAGWFFLVFSMGAHNGHSWVQGRVIDRLVLPTKEACEAARQGMEDYENAADKVLALHQAGLCQPVERDEKEEK